MPKRMVVPPIVDAAKRITPEEYSKAGTEHSHQVALFIWASEAVIEYPELRWLAAIPNGGLRHKAVAGRLKAEGVKAGFPDIIFAVPRGSIGNFCFGLFIEMKKPKVGRVAEKQNEWRDYLNTAGYEAIVCYGWVEARDALLRYINRN